MEALLQHECLTESQIETYKGQLGLVEGQLETGMNGSDTADLKQLKDNLTQLISLTEDTLLDLKKQRLLLSLQQTVSGDKTNHENRPEEEKEDEGKGEEESSREYNHYKDDGNDYQGIKCQAPMQEPWGAVNYHNAVILCREEDSTDQEGRGQENVMVRVLFTQPTSKAMKACPFYLDGKCRFDSSACNFSHGHVVPLSELLTYQEPDYNLACIGGKCMAKHSDDLWYPAIISSFDDEFTIHFPSLNTTVQIAIQNVFPLKGSESGSSSDSSESGEEEDEGGGEVVVEWTPRGAQRALGDWERYTTGIGSKLLAKMGYVVGQGLGRSGEGRVEPVEIKILPPGKSLDVCAEMREKGKIRKVPGSEGEGEGKRQRKRRKRRLLETTGLEEERKVDIFEFLNTKLQKDNSVEDTRATASRPKSGNLNVQLFTVEENIKVVMKRRQSLKTQLARHKGRDKTMEAHVMEKLSAVDKEIEKLQTEEKRIEKTLAMKSERKKLRIF